MAWYRLLLSALATLGLGLGTACSKSKKADTTSPDTAEAAVASVIAGIQPDLSPGAGGGVVAVTAAPTRNLPAPVAPRPNTAPVVALRTTVTYTGGASGNLISDDIHLLVTDADGDPITFALTAAPTGGRLMLADNALAVGDSFTAAELHAGAVTYDSNSGSTSDELTLSANDGHGGVVAGIVLVLQRASGPSPVLTLAAASLSVQEWYPALLVDAAATVTDADAGGLAYGVLFAKVAVNGGIGDELGVQSGGAGTGQVGVAGAVVSFEGVDIGVLSGGDAGATLRVDLNGAATVAAVQALVRSVTYRNRAVGPNEDARTLTLTIYDANGGNGRGTLPLLMTADKLVARWAFDDAPGTLLALDAVSHKASGKPVNVVNAQAAWGSGRFGGALQLDRANGEYLEATDPGGPGAAPLTSLKELASYSISLWAKPAATTLGQILVWQGEPGGNGWGSFQHEFHVHLNRYSTSANDDRIGLFYGSAEGTALHLELVPFALTTTDWIHVVAIVKESPVPPVTVTAQLYVNGVEVTTAANGPAAIVGAAAVARAAWVSQLRIGGPGVAPAARTFTGAIDELRVYNYPLTPAEVQALYTATP